MARMIPNFCDPTTPSVAERRMFDLLKSDPGTADWTVLHSLGLARRGAKPFGEIDFVALIPGAGVFCLEVKGGGVSCANGEWTTTDREGLVHTMNRSPFLQAREGMFEVRDAILGRAPMGFPTALVFGCAVIMPDINFGIVCQEWESWQVIDRNALTRPISAALLRLAASQRTLSPWAAPSEPSPTTIKIIQQLLRPDFEVVMTRGAQIDETELSLTRMTEDQFERLDVLMDNPCCLVEGAAGTGKTMLALECARRSAAEGKRTLLVCYNRLLGSWFERRVAEFGFGPTLVTGSIHRLLREMILRSSVAGDFLAAEKKGTSKELFNDVYPLFGQMALEELNQPFDVLVVDEAQDFFPAMIGVLDTALKGALVDGRCAIFGDFQRQAIYSSVSETEMKDQLAAAAPRMVRGRLRTNCRNTRNIGEETALLSGFESPPYRLGQIAGLPVDYQYFKANDEQRAKLAEVLRRLLADSVKAADIMVLSPLKLANSGIAGVDGGTDFRLIEADDSEPARSRIPVIRYCTAQAFKGMESPVVVLCDITQIRDHGPQSLLYVAMSRARANLIILLHEQIRPHMMEKIRLKLTEAWGKTP